MIQFYAPDIEETMTLPESDSAHCVRVLRKQPGDIIDVIDGHGFRYACKLLDANPKHAHVAIVGKMSVPLYWKNKIVLGIGPTKHLDRMEWLTEKLTEIGINVICPLLCRYSERKDIKSSRLEKIAVSAMKQSLKATLPEISDMMPFKKFIAQYASCPQKFIAHCSNEFPRKLLSQTYVADSDVVVLIGPEGDFSEAEIQLATEAGFIPVTLGDCRLRTETAALAAVQTFHTVNQLAGKES